MLPMVIEVFENIKHSADGMQYMIDHTKVGFIITLKASKGLRFRLLLDRRNFFNSSCARQSARVQEMWNEGVQLKIIKPKAKSGFACMHVKSWILDNKILLDGSCNMTHGGLDDNIEHLLKITTPSAAANASESFEKYWEQADEVTQGDIDKMAQNAEDRDVKKEDHASSSRSVSRSVSRSLSKELDEEKVATRK